VQREYADLLREASHLSGEFFFFWKGRVALYALLKAMGVREGDEVIVPAFTCVVVPNAILYLGAKPVYIDIENESYAPQPKDIECKIGPRTKCIICQNTFGLSARIEEIVAIARSHGIATIEDCTHGFGSTYKGRPNGSYCDAAFFSSQWNKPFSTGLGGYAYTDDPVLAGRIRDLSCELSEPTSMEDFTLRAMDFARRNIIKPWSYWPLVDFYRLLGKAGIVLGSSTEAEIASVAMPEGYFKAMSKGQTVMGMRALRSFAGLQTKRRKNAADYTEALERLGKIAVPAQYREDHGFLKYPLLVADRASFLEAGRQEHVALGEWFCSPLHPVEGDLSPWLFERGKYPVAEQCASHIVNLPTDIADTSKVLSFIERHRDEIL